MMKYIGDIVNSNQPIRKPMVVKMMHQNISGAESSNKLKIGFIIGT